jgi:hypothetical protein
LFAKAGCGVINRQKLLATFFSTRDFAGVNLLKEASKQPTKAGDTLAAASIHEKVFILRTRKHRRGAAL